MMDVQLIPAWSSVSAFAGVWAVLTAPVPHEHGDAVYIHVLYSVLCTPCLITEYPDLEMPSAVHTFLHGVLEQHWRHAPIHQQHMPLHNTTCTSCAHPS